MARLGSARLGSARGNCVSSSRGRGAAADSSYARRLRFEPLEDRRMLSIIADGFGPTFAQVSRVSGAEAAVL